jgi:hypothetical protein
LPVSSEHARVGRALDLLTQGLGPFVRRELECAFHADWADVARRSFRNDRTAGVMAKVAPVEWDAQTLLSVMWDQWNAVFRSHLGLFERSLVSELREFRNRWAHQAAFTDDDIYRIADSVERLLAKVEVSESILAELARLKFDVLREKLSRQVDDDLSRSRSRREKVIEVSLFVVSGLTVIGSTVVTMVPRNPLAGGMLVAFTALTFGYLIAQRLRKPVVIHGVHECSRCRKVIYNEVCPYCTALPSAPFHRRAHCQFPSQSALCSRGSEGLNGFDGRRNEL